MKISKYFLMAAAAMSLFACSNDNEALNNKDGNMTMIKLSLGKADTRGLEETAGNQYNTITDLRVEFFAADGRNLYVPVPEADLAAAVTALNSNKKEAVLGVNNVPIMATKIAVIANEKTLSTQIQTGNLNEAYKTKIMLSEMRADDAKPFSQIKSVLTGNGTLEDTSTGGVTTSTVNVSISAVSSRIEIGKIRAAKIAAPEGQTAVNVKEFYVQGIYINRFYTAGALSPENNALITDRKMIANGVEVGKYNKTTYTTNGVAFMCDEHVQNDPALVAQATNDANYSYEVFPKVEEGAKQLYWAYPTLATIPTVENDKTIANVPHIVLKLKVLYDNKGAEWLDRYVTVQAYKKGNVNGESVMNFERNTVYRIETLDFDINKLTQTPYEGNKTVTATIKVMPWHDQPIVPDWN